MTVRKMLEKDENALKEIIHLADPLGLNHPHPGLIYMRWGEYYYRNCRDHCFVVAEESEDRAVGVILCAPDTRAYQEDFNRHYYDSIQAELDKMEQARPGVLKEFHLEFYRNKEGAGLKWKHPIKTKQIYKEYPAHLHINIHPDFQRRGLGHLLVDSLWTHLKDMGIPGLHLIVGSGNEKGIGFYKKYGFMPLLEIRPRGKNGIFFGLKQDT